MKKLFLAAVLAICGAATAMASGMGSLGANFLYGSKFDQVGLGVSYKVNLTDNFRVAPEMQYFLKVR